MNYSEDAERMWSLADNPGDDERQLPPEALSRREVGEALRAARNYNLPSGVPRFAYPSPARSGSRLVLRWSFAGLAALVSAAFATLIILPLTSKPISRSHVTLSQRPAAMSGTVTPREVRPDGMADQALLNKNERAPRSAGKVAPPKAVGPRTVRLSRALRELAQLSGIKVQLAPGMPNPKVYLDPTSDSPEALLAQLALKNDFTIFDQGDGSILIIPAVDKNGGDRWKSGASVAGTR